MKYKQKQKRNGISNHHFNENGQEVISIPSLADDACPNGNNCCPRIWYCIYPDGAIARGGPFGWRDWNNITGLEKKNILAAAQSFDVSIWKKAFRPKKK